MKARVLDKAYKNEHDARVKERMLLIIRVSPDKQHIEPVTSELHRSRAWAYKWYKRYKDEGIGGLRDRPRSGKPSMVSSETTDKIIQELSNSNTAGWDFRQVMDLIQQKLESGTMKYIYEDYFTNGAFHQRYHRRGL